MSEKTNITQSNTEKSTSDETRRAFLAKYGRIAAVTPAAMTLMLSTSLEASGVSRSGGKPGKKKRKKRKKKRKFKFYKFF